jgi:hypothetical protein
MDQWKHPVVLGVRLLATSGETHLFHHHDARPARLQRRHSISKPTDGTSHIHKEKA